MERAQSAEAVRNVVVVVLMVVKLSAFTFASLCTKVCNNPGD